MNYIDQVAQFIEKNTSGLNIGSGSNDYADPFTGEPSTSLRFCILT